MKKTSYVSAIGLLALLMIGVSSVAHAQLRKDLNRPSDAMGPVVKHDPSQGAKLGNLFNMQMDHSYSMMFSSFGGQYSNVNAYTNTMRFFFSEDLTGRVDLSLLHSPFGNSFNSGKNGLGTKFIIRNAELNYQLSEKSNISIHFQQVPAYGMNPWSGGGGYYQPYYSPINDRNFD